ncbi:MAG: hypothetical protein OHK0031_17730 [Anaerolineales bacterium]
MSENEELVVLMEANDRLQAEIFKGALEAEGIPVTILQESAGSVYGFSGVPLGVAQICVPAQRLAEAQAWLSAYEKGDLENDLPESGE